MGGSGREPTGNPVVLVTLCQFYELLRSFDGRLSVGGDDFQRLQANSRLTQKLCDERVLGGC